MNIEQIKKLMERKRTAKKGQNGRVLVIGGSDQFVGSPALTSLGALRAGCDCVTLAAPEKIAWAVNKHCKDISIKKLKGNFISQRHSLDVIRHSQLYDCVVLGTGVTLKPSTEKFIHKFIKHAQKPTIIDGEALKIISLKELHDCIITPQFTELVTLLQRAGKDFLIEKLKKLQTKDIGQTLQANLRYFLENNNILVLKGTTDIIISRNRIYLNRTGNPGMAKSGTGDILAGLIGGFLAKTKDPFKAACAGTYINGLAGDILLKKKKGYSFIASDMIDELENLKKKKLKTR